LGSIIPVLLRFGVYIPKFIRDLGSSFDSDVRRQDNIHNTYENWRAFDPKPFRDYYKKSKKRKRSLLWGWLSI